MKENKLILEKNDKNIYLEQLVSKIIRDPDSSSNAKSATQKYGTDFWF